MTHPLRDDIIRQKEALRRARVALDARRKELVRARTQRDQAKMDFQFACELYADALGRIDQLEAQLQSEQDRLFRLRHGRERE